MRRRFALVALATASLALSGGAAAQVAPPPTAQNQQENGTAPSDRAATIAFTYNSDANADVSGGVRTGAAYLQRIGIIGDVDLDHAIGWKGASAHVSVQSIIGTGLSASRVGNLLTVSGIEASPALRLFNLWVEQKLGRAASLRVGQFTAGQEFAISPTANLFVNSTFGWPGSFAVDLPGGGPAYPIAVPGARLAVTADGGRSIVRVALFTGNPSGRDVHGLAGFRFDQPPLAIAETVRTAGGDDPAWTFVLGGWRSFDRYVDLRASAGRALYGNYAFYAIGDARLWHLGMRSLHGFARFTVSPGDRNLSQRYGDAGVTLTGAVPSRPHDVIGFAVAVAEISPTQTAAPPPEIALEASYQAHFGSNVYLQPNAQLILHPHDPSLGTASPIRRALVFGLRISGRR